MEDVVKVYAGFSIADAYRSIKLLDKISGMRAKGENVHKRIDAILEHVINEHTEKKLSKKEGNEDLVDVLLKIQKEGNLEVMLTHENIKAVVMVHMFVQNLNLFTLLLVVFHFFKQRRL